SELIENNQIAEDETWEDIEPIYITSTKEFVISDGVETLHTSSELTNMNENILNNYKFNSQNPISIMSTSLDTSSGTSFYFEQGVLLYTQGEVLNAINYFETDLHINIQNDQSWKYLGYCWAELDDDQKAIQ